MFLNLLTERQKQSFLALATKVVMADGGVVPEENVTLDVRKAEMGGSIMAPPEEIFGAANFSVFDTPQSRRIVVMELLVLAYSDDEYHVNERPIIEEFAVEFGLTPAEIEKFEDWARRQSPLSVEGWGMVSAED